MDEIEKKLEEIVRYQLCLDKTDAIGPRTTFDELGADSLDITEIMIEVEEVFDVLIPVSKEDSVQTFSDLVDLVQSIKVQ